MTGTAMTVRQCKSYYP